MSNYGTVKKKAYYDNNERDFTCRNLNVLGSTTGISGNGLGPTMSLAYFNNALSASAAAVPISTTLVSVLTGCTFSGNGLSLGNLKPNKKIRIQFHGTYNVGTFASGTAYGCLLELFLTDGNTLSSNLLMKNSGGDGTVTGGSSNFYGDTTIVVSPANATFANPYIISSGILSINSPGQLSSYTPVTANKGIVNIDPTHTFSIDLQAVTSGSSIATGMTVQLDSMIIEITDYN